MKRDKKSVPHIDIAAVWDYDGQLDITDFSIVIDETTAKTHKKFIDEFFEKQIYLQTPLSIVAR